MAEVNNSESRKSSDSWMYGFFRELWNKSRCWKHHPPPAPDDDNVELGIRHRGKCESSTRISDSSFCDSKESFQRSTTPSDLQRSLGSQRNRRRSGNRNQNRNVISRNSSAPSKLPNPQKGFKANWNHTPERELEYLNKKIERLLLNIDKNNPEENQNESSTAQRKVANSDLKNVSPEKNSSSLSDDDDECIICVGAKATILTLPCGHRVVCRRCFVKTIQIAVKQKHLPLTCIMCRGRILSLRHTDDAIAIAGVPGVPASASTTQDELGSSSTTGDIKGRGVKRKVRSAKKSKGQKNQNSEEGSSIKDRSMKKGQADSPQRRTSMRNLTMNVKKGQNDFEVGKKGEEKIRPLSENRSVKNSSSELIKKKAALPSYNK